MNSAREQYRGMNLEKRIKLNEKLFIMHPCFERCFSKIKECHQNSRVTAEPFCMLITGLPGVGKSTLCKEYLRQYPKIELTEKTKVPMLLSRIPIPATPKNLVTALLTELEDPIADKGTTYNKTQRLIKLLKDCEVELIILDEFQHFIDQDSDKILHTISDWLKQLINETEIPIILVGLPQSVQVLNSNSQLKRRFAMQDSLTDFKWFEELNHDPSEINRGEDYRFFLKALDLSLPLAGDSHLAGKVLAYRLWKATQGNVARTMKIIRYAARIALQKKEEKIDLDCLKVAYEKLFTDDTAENPFA